MGTGFSSGRREVQEVGDGESSQQGECPQCP